MSAPLVADIGSFMSTPLVADIDHTQVLLLLHLYRILLECSSCCRYRGSYTSAPLVADIENPT